MRGEWCVSVCPSIVRTQAAAAYARRAHSAARCHGGNVFPSVDPRRAEKSVERFCRGGGKENPLGGVTEGAFTMQRNYAM